MHVSTPMNGKYTLMKHQRYALACMSTQNHLAIFYEAGTGKTAIALTWLIRSLKEGRIKDALIICPASLIGNWRSSMDKMANFEGVSTADVELLKASTTIVSFRKTWKCVKSVHTHRDGSTYNTKSYTLAPTVDKHWSAIIVDESHALGGHSSSQTQACLLLARLATYRYIMTGTPVSGSSKASGKDWQKLYGQIRFLEPDRWRTWSAFCQECVSSYDKWYNPSSYYEKHCEELIQQYGIFAKLEDCVDMPGYTETTVPCELMEKKVYKDIKNMCVMEYNIDPKNSGTPFIKLLQICSGHLLDSNKHAMQLKTTKDEALTDLLSGTDDKIVIFCMFTESVDRCARIARKLGKNTVIFDGRSRTETWRLFQEQDAEVIVVQYMAGGAGLDLYAGNTMIMFEPCLSSLGMTQARARIYRKGQTEKCRYLYLSTPHTIEEKVWKSVLNGVSVTAAMLAEYSLES